MLKDINDFIGEYQFIITVPLVTLGTIFGFLMYLMHRNSRKDIVENSTSEEMRSEDVEGVRIFNTEIMKDDLEKEDISQAINQLCSLRQKIKPPALNQGIIPNDLCIIGKFNPDGKLRISVPKSIYFRIFVAAFCLPHYLLFPEIIVRGFELPWFGGVMGFFLWLWRNWRGCYISISLSKERYSLVMPSAFSSHKGFPSIEIKSSREENQRKTVWRTTFSIADQQIIERVSEKGPKIDDLETFTKSLQWRLGQPIKVGDGVYISP